MLRRIPNQSNKAQTASLRIASLKFLSSLCTGNIPLCLLPAYMAGEWNCGVTSIGCYSGAASDRGVQSQQRGRGQGMAEGLAKDPQPSGYMWRSSLMRSRTIAVPHRKAAPFALRSGGMRHARKFLLQAARRRAAGRVCERDGYEPQEFNKAKL